MARYTLKELRARHDLTQADVAYKLGISPQTYCGWEKDLSKVPIGKVKKLATLLEVSIRDIFS